MISKKQYIIMFSFAIILGITGGFFDLPFGAVVTVIAASVLLIAMIPYMYYMYHATDSHKVEQFLSARTRQPILGFYWALGQGDPVLVKDQLNEVLRKYKSPAHQAIFLLAEAAQRKDVRSAASHLLQVKQSQVREYYQVHLLLEEGRLEEAAERADSMSKEWMKESILGRLHSLSGDVEASRRHYREAAQCCKGVQRYLLEGLFESEHTIKGIHTPNNR
ncbi:hypothetical protein NDQ57_11500 [Rossellomorea marisflavi]|uniref:hypothetical protein n=1 Tax=Rossellomorea marisflavi TaxID=189381 RepID=UPI00203FF6D0|nr:hypothetical protein [Rossellomorea marisflavi]MCM2605313.1 hypothetical protein [Rossellomorea marisflavi]USK93503.1 hypothetical protein LIT29_07070 [Rossellomorea marisflavi]